jgi:hypothetical protein
MVKVVALESVLGESEVAAGAAEAGILVSRVPERRRLPHGGPALPWRELPAWAREQIGGGQTPTV